MMDKIVYESSTPASGEDQHYAVAILQDKELHCTPIKGLLFFQTILVNHKKTIKNYIVLQLKVCFFSNNLS